MSKNFELLSRAEKELEILQAEPPMPVAPTPSPGPRDLDTVAREEVVKLVQQVFLSANPASPRVAAFCGVDSGDGCSWVCARAAEALAAQVTGSVCVVDANLRSPSLHLYFNVENLAGLTESVCHQGEVRQFAQQLQGSNLWVVTAGSATSDPQTLLRSARLQGRIAELRGEFEFVLVDVPPVNLYADALALGQLADGMVMVLGAQATRREAARKAKETLLNKRKFPIPAGLYSRL